MTTNQPYTWGIRFCPTPNEDEPWHVVMYVQDGRYEVYGEYETEAEAEEALPGHKEHAWDRARFDRDAELHGLLGACDSICNTPACEIFTAEEIRDHLRPRVEQLNELLRRIHAHIGKGWK